MNKNSRKKNCKSKKKCVSRLLFLVCFILVPELDINITTQKFRQVYNTLFEPDVSLLCVGYLLSLFLNVF